MNNKVDRRDFLKTSGHAMLGATAGITSIDEIVRKFSQKISTDEGGGNNAKSSGSVITLPQGGGAVQGIGEKFQANPFTGTANFSVPIYTTPGRSGFGPELNISYSSGNGNGVFGQGWGFSIPKITRKTDKGLPSYEDFVMYGTDRKLSSKDIFVLSGSEDLVPYLKNEKESGNWRIHYDSKSLELHEEFRDYDIYFFRPRVEGLFAKIEWWVERKGGVRAKSFWKITTKDNITSYYGFRDSSKLYDFEDQHKVFEWCLDMTCDAKGNYIIYDYKTDNGIDVINTASINEAHRKLRPKNYNYQLYLKRIFYGNNKPFTTAKKDSEVLRILDNHSIQKESNYFFKVVFDYGEHGQVCSGIYDRDRNNNDTSENVPFPCNNIKGLWHQRPDPFSHYRAGFEIRTYRRCERVLMFHQISGNNVLVRSTDFYYKKNKYNDVSFLEKVTQRGYRQVEGKHFSEEYHLRDYWDSSWIESYGYAVKSFPPISFKYSEFRPQKQSFKKINAEGGDMPPKALSDPNFALVDLFGSGLPDVLNTSPYGYFYWKNKGNGQFSRRRELSEMPANVRLEMPGVGFGDMAGDGQADLLVHEGLTWGFYETDGKSGWKNFRPYKEYPSFNLNDSSVRLIDLTGDGKSDVLRTDDQSFVWFPCEGESGFGRPKHIQRKSNLDLFPNVDFSDPRVRLADMSGDNLNDIVMVHNGRIDYWANMGNGKFSERITLSNPPRFGVDFNPKRLFFADIDGSGTADMIYIDSGKVIIWFNQSGNRWSESYEVDGVVVTDIDGITITDFYGNGTNGLLVTRDYGFGRGNQYSFLDFSGGIKPNLLIEMDNNMGATTKVKYKPSTYFYRKDYEQNYKRSWASTLPFPVQVLEKVEKIDHISRTKLVTRYRYHHGFYDGKEREFRGFAFVEQEDTEFFDEFQTDLHDQAEVRNNNRAYHVSPILTKTWFHTGMYKYEELRNTIKSLRDNQETNIDIHEHFSYQYWQEDKQAFDLENTVFDLNGGSLDISSLSEAYRALRGQVLRQEVYALDDSPQSEHPYTVTESNAKIRLVQPKGDNGHAVYFVYPNESLSYHYERDPEDPRMVQELTLKVDDYGNVEKSVSIAYPRRVKSGKVYEPEQLKMHATLSQHTFINTPDQEKQENAEKHYYYLGLPKESQTFEIGNIQQIWKTGQKLSRTDIQSALATLGDTFEKHHNRNNQQLHKRLLTWSRSYFKKAAFAEQAQCKVRNWDHSHRLGQLDALALPYESFQVAFHNDQIIEVFEGAITAEELKNAGYIQLPQFEVPENQDSKIDPMGYWWVPSGQQSFHKEKFYQVTETCDPFGNTSIVEYEDLSLLINLVTNALGHIIEVKNDWVTMQPYHIIDPNGNSSKVAFDALGLVAASAVMENDIAGRFINGDPLEDFMPIWDYGQLIPYVDTPYQVSKEGRDHLKDASTAMIYDLWAHLRWKLKTQAALDPKDRKLNEPAVVFSISREEHHFVNPDSPVQRQLMYFDGLGREVQTKIEAEPNPQTNEARWINSGWKIFNNKGKPVQQYEPFYSYDFAFLDLYEMSNGMKVRAIDPNKNKGKEIEYGVSPIIFYDPLDRVVATVHPDGSYEKIEFDPWSQKTWDRNDTVNWNPAFESSIANWWAINGPILPDGTYNSSFFKTWKERIEEYDDAMQAALHKTLKHADTPSITHLDTLGRPFLSITKNNDTEFLKAPNGNPLYQYLEEQNTLKTHIHLDIQGNDLAITDPRGNILFEHTFNMLKQQMFIHSKDAGKKRILLCIDKVPFWSKDARNTIFEQYYDKLRRPIKTKVWPLGGAEITVLETTYDAFDKDDNGKIIQYDLAAEKNTIGQVIQIKDQAGILDNTDFDFKGNIKATKRQLWDNYTDNIDLSVENNTILKVGKESYLSFSNFDALNRVIDSTAPDNSIFLPKYNKSNQLASLQVNLAKFDENANEIKYTLRDFVLQVDYNARGQRTRILYGSGINTTFKYDSYNFRLEKMVSSKNNGATLMQNLYYAYDPVGNITQIGDYALETIFCCNEKIEPVSTYTYDALYRLTRATGRQHLSYNACQFRQDKQSQIIDFQKNAIQPRSDEKALTNYTEHYEYDKAGNIRKIKRCTNNANANSCTRVQEYESLNNRIKSTYKGNDTCHSEKKIIHDNGELEGNGNITSMPHLKAIEWDFANQMRTVKLNSGVNDYVYYVYGSDGMRTRKVVETSKGIHQRIYLNGYEIYINGTKEKETLHVNDDATRIALIETEIDHKIRYQLNNHLGSASLETKEDGELLTYEEYAPYGGSTFIASKLNEENKAVAAEQKRYRYSGKEREDKTGLYYYGARYYAPWMGRWMKADPIGKEDGLNVYGFVKGNPINSIDESGTITIPNIQNQYDATWYYLAEGFGSWFEFLFGGNTRPSQVNKPKLPEGGIGGVSGGALHTLTLRLTPLLEDNHSELSGIGMEQGASMISVGPVSIDGVLKLVTRESVTGKEVSRQEALIDIAVQVVVDMPGKKLPRWQALKFKNGKTGYRFDNDPFGSIRSFKDGQLRNVQTGKFIDDPMVNARQKIPRPLLEKTEKTLGKLIEASYNSIANSPPKENSSK